MKLTLELAKPIVNQLMSLLDYNINIMDETGVIIASGDPERIKQEHEGALKVIHSQKEVIINDNESKLLAGTKPGVNLPIYFQNQIIGVVGITGIPEEIYKYAKVVKLTVETLMQQFYLMNQVRYQGQMIEGWISELINPNQFNEPEVESKGLFLHIDLMVERIAYVVRVEEIQMTPDSIFLQPEKIHKLNEMKDEILSLIKKTMNESVSCYHGDELIILTVSSANQRINYDTLLAEKLKSRLNKCNYTVKIGIGKRESGIKGYRVSYYQAKQSLHLMRKLQTLPNISHTDDWGIIRILDHVPGEILQSFVKEQFKDNLNDELLATLQVFIDCNLNAQETIKRLYIHRNTLQYRLEKITEKLQLDPRTFKDAFLLKILLISKCLTNQQNFL
ncbi:MAG: sugar diacid recognition domain-containing protein [Paenibacillaceae bacterium]